MFVSEKLQSSIERGVLHALPTSILVIDSNERVILANLGATRLLKTQREYIEGGPLSRFLDPGVRIGSASRTVAFHLPNETIELVAVSKEIIIDEDMVNVVLLRSLHTDSEGSLTNLISGFSKSQDDPFLYICNALVDLEITKYACVRKTYSTNCEILASTTDKTEIFSLSPSVARTVSKDETTHVEIVIIPDNIQGLTSEDISTIDMFISLLNLRVNTQETASDASGSETALALALKAGDMGMAFFDPSRNECYLSDRLAIWCSINPETFSGSITDWLSSFRSDDKERITKLFSELTEHKKFKTVVNLETLEQDMRLELTGRPLEPGISDQWVTIARPFSDEEEVQAAWQTRIAMEETARVEAEEQLELFESILGDTLLPTTSDVTIQQSRQDAGTWHIARPFGKNSSVYCVGAVNAMSRSQAIIGATVLTTIADVLATQIEDVDTYVSLIRDHARARDIETTIACVRVVDGHITSATHNGASVFISGKSFTGSHHISETTALSLSTHSQATPETVEVASNGRPWKIMTTVIEVVSIIDSYQPREHNLESPQLIDIAEQEMQENTEVIDQEIEDNVNPKSFDKNVTPFRSGSINPNS